MALRNQGRTERRRSERRSKPFTRRAWIIMGGGILVLVIILGALIASSGGGTGDGGRYPGIGDHWHAEYSVIICGAEAPPFPDNFATSPDIHTHADGVIHIEPRAANAAGRNATLARFMAGTGSRLTNTSIELLSGVNYKNGDRCRPDEAPGQVFLRVNGINRTEIASYVPRDGDVVELGFEAQGQAEPTSTP